ncbi:alpha-ribazole phosphatase family protein [Psychromonas algicola]|uniref:alpha-ribazole phosphatase family protein n=1 Tax=Psychromonas algicola TaxID=2555642 RepID=UPI00106891CA|nr:alpha-ribazole phosphatase family protein [Psychromonas sp. RZ5]TEW52036.1 hypothetical protein E2R67_04520 [Psychromonas sp. RZ5]
MSQSESNTLITHQIYLVRHGEVNVPVGVCYGQLNCEVSAGFEAEQARLIDYFTNTSQLESLAYSSPIIISSPLKRCVQLAQTLNQALESQADPTLQAQLHCNDAFKEINFGDWEGQSWQNIGQDKIESWNNDLIDYTFPNGESARSFDARVINAWDELKAQLARETSSKTIIIITHAGVIRSILSHFLHIPLQHSLLLNIDKLSISHLNLYPQFETLSRCMFVNKKL